MKQAWALAWADARAQPQRLLGQALGLALGIFILALILSLGQAARSLVLGQLVQELPHDTLEVLPRSLDLGLLQWSGAGGLGGRRLDDAALAQLAALPEARAVHPRLELPLPLGVQGGARLFGHDLYADVFVTALPAELLAAELGDPALGDPAAPIPVAYSALLIETYNAAIAPVLHAPQLTDSALRGLSFDLVVGRSLLLGRRGARQEGRERARLAGVSRYARRLSLLVPLERAEALLARYSEAPAAAERIYDGALVQAASAAALPSLASQVEALGFDIDQTAQRARQAIALATALASSLGLLVLGLAASGVAQSCAAQLQRQRRSLAVLRALGARRGQLLSMVLLQAIGVGLIGGGLGLAGGRGLTGLLNLATLRRMLGLPAALPSLPTLPLSLSLACLAAACLAACLGAALPAWRTARTNIASLLKA